MDHDAFARRLAQVEAQMRQIQALLKPSAQRLHSGLGPLSPFPPGFWWRPVTAGVLLGLSLLALGGVLGYAVVPLPEHTAQTQALLDAVKRLPRVP
jgi:hypothetical protein